MLSGGTPQTPGAAITRPRKGEGESVGGRHGLEEIYGRLYHTEVAATNSRAQRPGQSVHWGSGPAPPVQSCCVDGEKRLGHLCNATQRLRVRDRCQSRC
ncbi:hypothetical protein MTO96_011952 [Rhipicephalus appendiculatus]